MKYLFIFLIKLYQKTVSPDHGLFKALYPHGFCKFYPSCSEYAVQSINSKGVVIGIWLAVKRIARCNPFTNPKIDPVR